MKHVLLLLAALLFLMATAAFLMISHGYKTQAQQARAKPTPVWDATRSTPGPDPDIQELLRHAPPLK